jgi:hypothetical protein
MAESDKQAAERLARRSAAEIKAHLAWRKKMQRKLRKKTEMAARQAAKRRAAVKKSARDNPPLKKLNKSTGWMQADAVKITRNRGKIEVRIRRKPRRKTASKRRR